MEERQAKLIDLLSIRDELKQLESFNYPPEKTNFSVKNNGILLNNYIIIEHDIDFKEPDLKNLLIGAYLSMNDISNHDSLILTKDQYKAYETLVKKNNNNYKIEVTNMYYNDGTAYGPLLKFKNNDETYAEKLFISGAEYYKNKEYDYACQRFLTEVENNVSTKIMLDITDCWKDLLYVDGKIILNGSNFGEEYTMKIPRYEGIVDDLKELLERLNPNK